MYIVYDNSKKRTKVYIFKEYTYCKYLNNYYRNEKTI